MHRFTMLELGLTKNFSFLGFWCDSACLHTLLGTGQKKRNSSSDQSKSFPLPPWETFSIAQEEANFFILSTECEYKCISYHQKYLVYSIESKHLTL